MRRQIFFDFRFSNRKQLISIFPPSSSKILNKVSFAEFYKESFENSFVAAVPGGNNENSCLLFLGWKGMTLDFKILTTEKSVKSYVPLPT